MDFETVRETLLGWVGHAIIGIELEAAAVPATEEEDLALPPG